MLKKRLQPGVFVLGMHRSGTSAAVLCLESLGLSLCLEDDRLKSSFGNPDHGESLSVITFNDRLLNLSDSDWTSPGLNEGWMNDPEVKSLLAPARLRFIRMHPKKPWAVKDPRLCLTMPFWEEALDVKPPILFIVRNPLEVAESMKKRDAEIGKVKSDEHYFSMWERYMRSALFYAQGHSVFVCNYSDLVDEWPTYKTRIGKWLRSSGFDLPEEDKDSPIQNTLRHANMHGSLQGLSHQQRRLYVALSEINGEHGFLALPRIGNESEKTSALFGAEAYVRKIVRQPTLEKWLSRLFPQMTTRSAQAKLVKGLQLSLALAVASLPIILLNTTGIADGVNDWIIQSFANIHQPFMIRSFDFSQTIIKSNALYWVVVAVAGLCLAFRKRMSAFTLLIGLALVLVISRVVLPYTSSESSLFAAHLFQLVVLSGLIVYVTLKTTQKKVLHMVVMITAGVMVAVTALGRIYLQIHTPSAVLISLLLGATTVVTLVTLSESLRGYGQIPKRS